MIINFSSKAVSDIYNGISSRYARSVPTELHAKARRLLDLINAAHTLGDLKAPPSNNLESLKGDLEGKWSIRINKQWRIVFRWNGNNAQDVDIVDYH